MNKKAAERIKAGVIGVGYLGKHHARIYSGLDGVELAGVADTDFNRAEEIAKEFNTRAFSDYRDLLAHTDALSIVVPTTLHYEIALECLRAGKDIIVEKPITATIAEADGLISEAGKKGRVLQVGHLERYNSGIITLNELIDRPVFFESLRLSPFLNRAADVDVTLDLMIHDIDIVLSLAASPVKSIKAIGFSSITEMIDEARAWIEFENGLAGFFTASRVSDEKQRKLRVFQDSSYIELDYQSSSLRRFQQRGPLEEIKPEYREPLKEELMDFIDCVIKRKPPRVSGVQGRDALKVVLEINSLVR